MRQLAYKQQRHFHHELWMVVDEEKTW